MARTKKSPFVIERVVGVIAVLGRPSLMLRAGWGRRPQALEIRLAAKGAKLHLQWLGDLDSNQGCPVQSRKFYR